VNSPINLHDPDGFEASGPDEGFATGAVKRLWQRATAPTEAQKAFKEKRYGDFAKHTLAEGAINMMPAVGGLVGDVQDKSKKESPTSETMLRELTLQMPRLRSRP
jgi:hypothetical protein